MVGDMLGFGTRVAGINTSSITWNESSFVDRVRESLNNSRVILGHLCSTTNGEAAKGDGPMN